MSSTRPDFTPTDSTSPQHAAEPTQRAGDNDAELRRLAVKRLEDKRGLMAHALAYVLVNLLLVAVWRATGAVFFWPVFPIFGWGIGLAFHAWSVFWPEPGPAQIEREIERIKQRR
jgi:hypothetical protein